MVRYELKGTRHKEIGAGYGCAYDCWKVYNNNNQYQRDEYHYYRLNGYTWIDTSYQDVRNRLGNQADNLLGQLNDQ